MRSIRLVALLVVAVFVLGGCGSPAKGGEKVRVVASFYPLEEIAVEVGGSQVAVRNLTPAGAEPHDLELRPSDLASLRSADLVVYAGRGFQPAVEDALESEGEETRKLEILGALQVAGEDPHFWLDPVLMQHAASAVRDALRDLLPAQADRGLGERVARFGAAMAGLDAEYRGALATCKRRELVTTHAAFGFLAQRYGLEQVAISGLSPEAEPSPRRLQDVARIVRDRGVTTIFFESLVSARTAGAIARATGARVALLDPIEGLAPERIANGEDYVTVMRDNLRALVEALACER